MTEEAMSVPGEGEVAGQAESAISPPLPTEEVTPVQPPPPGSVPSADSRNWAVAAHLSSLVMLLGIPSLIGPLVVWLIKKDQDPFVADQAKEALNFNISVFLYAVVSTILALVLVGLVLLVMVGIGWVVLTILAAVEASKGNAYRYPFTLRLVS